VGDSDDIIDVIVEATNEVDGEAIGLKGSTISSGGGDDSIYIETWGESSSKAMVDSLIEAGDGDDYITIDGEIENGTIDAGDGDDVVDLYGTGNATIKGGAGEDELNGDEGADTLLGGTDNDILNGFSGNDILKGGQGDDILDAGVGLDKLYGGDGLDTFILNLGDGFATIYDFVIGQDTVGFAEVTEVRMEYQDTNSNFYSGADYLGVANGVELSRQEDNSFA
jgi:Ca2+-binding RTX toxin-like protein